MAKGSRRNADGTVTRPTGQASPAKSGGTGRGFTPQGNKGGGGGPAIRRTGGAVRVAPKNSANKVEGKG